MYNRRAGDHGTRLESKLRVLVRMLIVTCTIFSIPNTTKHNIVDLWWQRATDLQLGLCSYSFVFSATMLHVTFSPLPPLSSLSALVHYCHIKIFCQRAITSRPVMPDNPSNDTED